MPITCVFIVPPYSESEYKCHVFRSSFELNLNIHFSTGGTHSSSSHVRAEVCNIVKINQRLAITLQSKKVRRLHPQREKILHFQSKALDYDAKQEYMYTR